jgi:acyl carrier protein
VVAEICRQLLGLPYVGIHDNLLLLGAHSLIAAQVVARIRNRLNIELPLSTVFEYPTIASLAREIEARHGAPQSDPLTVPRPARRDQPLPLSTAQQRLWLLDQLDPGLSVYNAAARIRLTGRLDRAALETSLAAVVTRHEALRTVFATNGDEPIQVVRPPAPVALPFTDLRSLRTDRRNHEIEALARGEAAQPFDLECDLMIRARLLQVQDEEHILLLTLHHIASDRWSFNVLLQEIHALYARACGTQTPPLQDLPVQYADYALWERSTLEPTVYRRQLEYWRIQLGDLAEAPLLPPDQPRGDTQTFTGATLHSEFPADLVTTLNELARRLHATTYMALLAAFHLLLNVRTDQSTIATGTNVANRTHLELEGLIGFFVNQIVLRSDLSGNPTFLETLAQLRETVLQGYAHQQVPFDLVVADQKRARTANSSPLFQILFVQNTLISPLKQGDLTIHPPEFDSSTSKFDLAVFAEEAQGTLRLTWIYKADLFRASTIARLAQQFAQIVATVVREPEITRDALKSRLAQMDREERSDVARDRDVTSRRLLKSVVPKSVSPDPD